MGYLPDDILVESIFEVKDINNRTGKEDYEIFCTCKHVFIYKYNNDYEKLHITRIARDVKILPF